MPFVIHSGSKQYLVEPGQKIIVDRLEAEENSTIELPVVYTYGSSKGTTVKAKVIKHQKGEKIRVVKFKNKSNYHRQYGFRAYETILEIM